MAVSVEQLRAAGLDPAFEKLERTIASHKAGDAGNVAVVSDPFAGREVLLDYADQRFEDSVRLSLEGVTSRLSPPELPDADVVIVDDCHYLFRRRIDGFDVLDRITERMATEDALYITSWNRYAWEYLTAVRDVQRTFPTQVSIPRLGAAEIEHLLEAYQGEQMPEFVYTSEEGRIKTVSVDSHDVRLVGSRTVDVPVPRPNPEWVSSWWVRDDEESIEAVVYEKIRRVSHGNPGIATTVWEQSVTNGEIAPAYVRDLDLGVELDDDQAYLLVQVVSMESIARSTLEELTGDVAVGKALKELIDQEIVTERNGAVSITPLGLHPAVKRLEGRRLLW